MSANLSDGKGKEARFHFDNIYFHNPQLYETIMLYQVGDLSCRADYEVGEHWQFCYELSYIVSGRGFFDMDGISYAVKEGDIVLNLPGQLHNCRADAKEPFRYFYVGFHFLSEARNAHLLLPIKKRFDQSMHPVVSSRTDIATPFIRIFQELIHRNHFSELMIESHLREIIVLAYRSFCEHDEEEYAPDSKAEDPKQIVYEVVNYIDANLLEINELAQLAEKLSYNYSYLSRLFSRETGQTIQEYYNRKRFDKAVTWMQQGKWSITQIAEKLRYQSLHAFSKAFRKHFGISPSEYQSLLRTAKNDQIPSKQG